MPGPLGSEAGAFRVFAYVVAAAIIIAIVVALARTL
jgi:hypothetical protein